MKIFLFFIFLLLNANFLSARSIGETEITAEEGIEVFQDEKYYLLKKNVKIVSDNFILKGDLVKIFFENDLYDVQIIDAIGNVDLDSTLYNVKAKGEKLYFIVKTEEIDIQGKNSKLITNDTQMFSDGKINVENIKGNFFINGPNSKLKSQEIIIEGNKIEGTFSNTNDPKEIVLLDVNDNNIAYINSDGTEMFANIINYNKDNSLIQLEKNVKIIRDGEVITGDFGTLDTETNSYKIKSKESKRVKAILKNKDE